jgi:hypothetical protein
MKRAIMFLLMVVGIIGCGNDDKGASPSGDMTALPMQLGSQKNSIGIDIDGEGIINPADTAIWPLKEGNQWTIAWTLFDSTGSIKLQDTFTLGVGEDTIIDGEVWHVILQNGVPDPEIGPGTNRSDGLWAGGSSGTLQFKFPAAVNNSYRVEEEWMVVESVDEVLTVAAGTYDCYCYLNYRPSDRRVEYRHIAPNVGYVMTDEYYRMSGGEYYHGVHSELIEIDLDRSIENKSAFKICF